MSYLKKHVVKVLIIDSKKRYLLLFRSRLHPLYGGQIDFSGGLVDIHDSETALEACVRETYEEANIKTADILLDGVEFEIKSPITNKPDKLERNIKRALKQVKNVIIDSSRIKNMKDDNLRRFLVEKARNQKQIGELILITKRGQIIDISALV